MTMSLMPWDWFKDDRNGRGNRTSHSLSNIYSDMERTMREMMYDYIPSSWRESSRVSDVGLITPRVNVSETDASYKISIEMPGVKEEDIDLSISNGMLNVKAEKKEEKEDSNEHYHRLERYYGTFQRSMSLPDNIKGDAVEAVFQDGVLNILVPKDISEQKKPMKIKLKH